MTKKYLYVFIDESGNLNFSAGGSKYFVISTLAATPPFKWDPELLQLKYRLIQECELEDEPIPCYFHATEDKQTVRDEVFKIISGCIGGMRVDSVVVEKRKTGPALRETQTFYPKMLGYLVRYLLQSKYVAGYDEIIIITDRLPVNEKKRAVEKAIKKALAEMLPSGMKYKIYHHPSQSCMGLQMIDYIGWAILRKWESDDIRSYSIIKQAIVSEFDIFRSGNTFYY